MFGLLKKQKKQNNKLFSLFLSFSLPLQMCGPLAHAEQEDVPCV